MASTPAPLAAALATAALWLAPASAARAEWGFGAAVGVSGSPGMSVQYVATPREAYHVVTHVGNAAAGVQADYQRFYFPRDMQSRTLRAGTYAGLGLGGEAARDEGDDERWYLRLPLGVQIDVVPLHLSTFAEIAAKVGALPGTGLETAASGGIRAYF